MVQSVEQNKTSERMMRKQMFNPYSFEKPLMVGAGFVLGFGWLWFDGMREIWFMDSLGVHLVVSEYMHFFLAAITGCCLLAGFCWQYIPRMSPLGLSLSVHLMALACMAGTLFAGQHPLIMVLLLGGSGALMGVYWFGKILDLPWDQGMASLAFASFMSVALCLVKLYVPESKVLFMAFWYGGIVVAFCLSYLLLRFCSEHSVDVPLSNTIQVMLPFSLSNRVWIWLCAFCGVFFILGALHAAAVDSISSVGSQTLHLVGTLAAMFMLLLVRRRYTDSTGRVFNSVFLAQLAVVYAFTAIVLLSILLWLSPILFVSALPMASGLLEILGIGVIGFLSASACEDQRMLSTSKSAGIILACILLSVNLGYIVELNLANAFESLIPVTALAFGAVGLGLFLSRRLLSLWLFAYPQESVPVQIANVQEPPASIESSTEEQQEVISEALAIKPDFTKMFNPQELKVIQLVLRGYSNKVISESMGLKENTIRWYLKKINKKIGANTRQDLVDILADR